MNEHQPARRPHSQRPAGQHAASPPRPAGQDDVAPDEGLLAEFRAGIPAGGLLKFEQYPETFDAGGAPITLPSSDDVFYDPILEIPKRWDGSQWKVAGNGTYQALLSTSVWTSGNLAIGVNTVDATAGNKTPTLPTPTAVGQLLSVEKIDSSVNTVTISGTIRGAASSIALVWQYETVVFEADSLTSWRPLAGHKTKASLDASYVPFGTPYGLFIVDLMAGADDDAKMAAALTAWQASTRGGTIQLAARSYTFTQAWQPNSASYGAGAAFTQPYLRITGSGPVQNGQWQTPLQASGTTANFTYNSTAPAKIDVRGIGVFELDNIAFRDASGGNLPFVQVTNTEPKFHDLSFEGSKSGTSCDQDAIVLGGTNITEPVTAAADGGFQGYGGFVRDIFYSGIRRGVFARYFCNGFTIERLTFSTSCGATTAAAAIEVAGASSQATTGVIVRGCVVEVSNYAYGIKGTNLTNCTFGPNGFYDPTATHKAGVWLDTTAQYCEVIDGYRNDAYPLIIDLSLSSTIRTAHQSQRSVYPQPAYFLQPVIFGGGNGPATIDNGGNQVYWRINGGNNPYPKAQIVTIPGTQVTDGVTTSGSPTVTSATAVWTAADRGLAISGTGIPANTYIADFVNATTVTLSKNATASGTAITFTWGRQGTSLQMTQFERHHIVSTGSAPSGAVDAAAGTGAVISITGNDFSGIVTLTTGTGPASGQLCHWNPAIAWTATPNYAFEAKDATTAALLAGGRHTSGSTSAQTKFSTVNAPAASTVYTFSYVAIQ